LKGRKGEREEGRKGESAPISISPIQPLQLIHWILVDGCSSKILLRFAHQNDTYCIGVMEKGRRGESAPISISPIH
jgi:hypothetical protein